MAFEVLTSQLSNVDEFNAAVTAYIARLKAFNNEVGVPRPTAPHPLIEACVQRVHRPDRADDYVADYFITDDRPPPPSLADKKQQLFNQVLQAETAARDKLLPQGKMRILVLENQAAEATALVDRTPEQTAAIIAFQTFKKAYDAVTLSAAKAEAEVADLTEANIDSWVLPQIG